MKSIQEVLEVWIDIKLGVLVWMIPIVAVLVVFCEYTRYFWE